MQSLSITCLGHVLLGFSASISVLILLPIQYRFIVFSLVWASPILEHSRTLSVELNIEYIMDFSFLFSTYTPGDEKACRWLAGGDLLWSTLQVSTGTNSRLTDAVSHKVADTFTVALAVAERASCSYSVYRRQPWHKIKAGDRKSMFTRRDRYIDGQWSCHQRGWCRIINPRC